MKRMTYLKPDAEKKGSWALPGASIMLSMIVFLFIAFRVVYQHHDALDRTIMLYFSKNRNPGLVRAMTGITFLGSSLFLLPSYLLLVTILLLRKASRTAIAVALISSLSWLTLRQIKIVFHRQRPPLPLVSDISSYSFPSAHAFSSLIFFTILASVVSQVKMNKELRKILITGILICPLLVGLSRIILGVHYFSDVVAGFCLAISWLTLSFWFLFKPVGEYYPSSKTMK